MSPYEDLLAKYKNLKSCRNELLDIVKTVQPNGFLKKAIRRAEALQKAEKNDFGGSAVGYHGKLHWELNND